jgi:hypothetical protein
MENQSDVPNIKIVIVVAQHLGIGLAANRAAVIATGLAAHVPNMIGSNIVTKDKRDILGFTQIPMPILVARPDVSLLDLAEKSEASGCTTIVFLTRAQGLRSYKEYIESIKQTDYKDLDIDAVGIAGDTKQVTKLTGNLPSLR